MPKVSEDHLAARRRQILDGARRCFAEYGYDKATVRRLEQAIGMSRGAIFHHFRDKDALFFALAREDTERMAAVASREGLIGVMRDMLAAPDQFDWLATRLEIARKLRNDPDFSRGWAERSAELAAATTDRLRRQKQANRVRDDVPSDVLLVLPGPGARRIAGPAGLRRRPAAASRRPRPGGELGASVLTCADCESDDATRRCRVVRFTIGGSTRPGTAIGAAAAAHRGA